MTPRLNFLRSTTTISTEIPFQLAVASPPQARLSGFTFDSLEIHFNDDRPPVVFSHSTESRNQDDTGKVERYEVKRDVRESQADLAWRDGTTKVFFGSVSSDVAISLTVSDADPRETISLSRVLTSEPLSLFHRSKKSCYALRSENGISLQTYSLPTKANLCGISREGESFPSHRTHRSARELLLNLASFPRYSCSLASAGTHSIMPRVLELSVDVEHSEPAYLGERYPITLDVHNRDEIEVEISLVGFVQPGPEGSREHCMS